MLIYPNPFTDHLKIIFNKEAGFKRLLLRSISGNLLIDKNINSSYEVNLNTSELRSGCYLLTLISDQQVMTYKLIK